MDLRIPMPLDGNGPYAVAGVPQNQTALIMKIDNRWRILRTVDDVSGGWRGQFETAQDALAALRIALDQESTAAAVKSKTLTVICKWIGGALLGVFGMAVGFLLAPYVAASTGGSLREYLDLPRWSGLAVGSVAFVAST